MDRKSIAQEYYMLVVDCNGSMPPLHKEESKAGAVAAGYMDLLLSGCISVEKKKIMVIKKMPMELEHLASLYAYLEEKPRTIENLMSDYVASMGGRLKQLLAELGASLAAAGMVIEGKNGFFGNKTVYIPEKGCKNELLNTIRFAVMQEEEISPHDMALFYILKKTKNLKQYLSKYEREAWKALLKEIKNNPQHKYLTKMINYESDMMALIGAMMFTNT